MNSSKLFVPIVSFLVAGSHAWICPHTRVGLLGSSNRRRSSTINGFVVMKSSNDNNDGPFSFLTNPYESKIPDELRDEIYAAEANTPAAQERGVRVATYAALAFVGILFAFFNAFITEIRTSPLPPEAATNADPLVVSGFDWVRSNPITSFLFTTKIGGGISLLGGAGSGLLAEAELDTKRINAEKIFEEMQRRRDKKLKKEGRGKKKKKKLSGKAKKRIGALSEVVTEDTKQMQTEVEETVAEKDPSQEEIKATTEEEKIQEDGIMGKLKGFYDKADSMAASQALLLNKELEDRGMIEKITDETGLKVIGREEASKLEEEKQRGGKSKAK